MAEAYPSRHERGYDSKWVKLRANILARDLYLCQHCLDKGRPTPATDVDHITPKSKGGDDAPDNLQALCRECHNRKTRDENKGRGKGAGPAYDAQGWPIWGDEPSDGWPNVWGAPLTERIPNAGAIIVCGPPASGKTTWARECDGIVYDLDDIAKDMGLPRYGRTLDQAEAALTERRRRLRQHDPRDRLVLVVTAPKSAERERWASALDGTVHVMPTSPEECAKRIRATRRENMPDQLLALDRYLSDAD